jgi:hypothetical protein
MSGAGSCRARAISPFSVIRLTGLALIFPVTTAKHTGPYGDGYKSLRIMDRTCQAPGCWAQAASSFAAYCRSHRTALRRHGAVDQKAISQAQLKPYLKLVKVRIAKNPDNQAWQTLDNRWRVLVQLAQDIIAHFESGKAGNKYELMAAREVVKLAPEVRPRDVVEVVDAMIMMRIMEPRCFKSDEALWLQLARRVRGLTDLHVGERWDHTRRRVRRRYRELSPKAALFLGHWLAKALGVAGQGLAKAEQAERDRCAKESRELNEALSKLV